MSYFCASSASAAPDTCPACAVREAFDRLPRLLLFPSASSYPVRADASGAVSSLLRGGVAVLFAFRPVSDAVKQVSSEGRLVSVDRSGLLLPVFPQLAVADVLTGLSCRLFEGVSGWLSPAHAAARAGMAVAPLPPAAAGPAEDAFCS